MPRAEFLGRVLEKIEKLDRSALKSYLQDLKGESDFLRRVLDSLSEGVLVVGRDATIKFMSRGAKSILGISHAIDPQDRSLREVIMDEQLRELLVKNLCPQSSLSQEEFDLLRPHPATLAVSLVPLYGLKGENEGAVVLLVNTTLPRERDRRAVHLQKVESLASLAAGIAHEIGNPLNSIVIYLKILQKEMESVPLSVRKKLQHSIDIIWSETKRLDRLVKNFLTATRRKPIEFKEDNVNRIIEQTVHVMSAEVGRCGVTMRLRLSKEMPPFLMDAEKIRQVLINLIKNAIESMPEGGQLEITSLRRDKICTVVFKDEGVGIPEEILPRIFDAYFTTKEEGSGLGLLIVSHIIQEHSGRIEVKSKVGQGTAFIIHLPIRHSRLQLTEKSPGAE